MDKATAPPSTFVGIDVAKHRLDIHSRPSGESFAFGHDDESMAALVGRLAALAPAPALVVLSATTYFGIPAGMVVELGAQVEL